MLIVNDLIIFFFVVKCFGNEDVQSYNNDGWMMNFVMGNIFFEVVDFDFDVYFVIDILKIGEIIQVFLFVGFIGEIMYCIVQL